VFKQHQISLDENNRSYAQQHLMRRRSSVYSHQSNNAQEESKEQYEVEHNIICLYKIQTEDKI
jgi:hypothetical protein